MWQFNYYHGNILQVDIKALCRHLLIFRLQKNARSTYVRKCVQITKFMDLSFEVEFYPLNKNCSFLRDKIGLQIVLYFNFSGSNSDLGLSIR